MKEPTQLELLTDLLEAQRQIIALQNEVAELRMRLAQQQWQPPTNWQQPRPSWEPYTTCGTSCTDSNAGPTTPTVDPRLIVRFTGKR